MGCLILVGVLLASSVTEQTRPLYKQMCAEVERHPPVAGEVVTQEIGEPLAEIMQQEGTWQTLYGWPSAADVIVACQEFRART